ncbi:dTDP-4-dehydrorhamnose 3,5-epimerase [Flavobacterium sp. NST-5]|uniref:dTDP-4-dehydrorhamnose 3,5-epimerase n=1 Tax=Flavobacterium ichthyis TaxID=2698827 RepID=A0ABW9Z8A1_9FLAO|nr:dTDP-4-dehydrorhamnose 3,5-epimerase [Flavobacterium ichthyis]NBL64807.1 dTDP-4-dehydrorhamnose 3,5-epimerase [Flavobacterium ichthyis]
MLVEQTTIEGLKIITPKIFGDDRGYFFEAYNQNAYTKNGIDLVFIQDNQSSSKKNVIRGLHLQLPPFAQSKLVRVLQGEILDVAVDVRPESPTFGQHFSIVLSEENHKQLLIPKGFAHGFSVLSEEAVVAYKIDEVYDKDSERSIKFDDPALAIDWKVNSRDAIVSEKDQIAGTLADLKPFL